MSKVIFTLILNEVLSRSGIRIKLGDFDRDQLYMELLNHFGLIGGLNVCEALEKAWQDPYNRSRIEDYITTWIRRKMRRSIMGGHQTGVV
ncbi:MAG: hypothetical protein QXK89_00480 [Candidatus Bathyarchaeia archaeon]